MRGYMGWGMIDEGWRKGPWTAEEDGLLIQYVNLHGEGRWNSLANLAGLKRNGKSCRLRWVNYLRPDLKRGQITPHEETIIIDLHARWGNRWSTIARSLPGRTDNEIKNYWRTHFKKAKASSFDNSEKAKTRFLKRQQFHHLQQQKQQSQQQELLTQLHHQSNTTKIMSLHDENERIVSYIPQMRHDMTVICPHTAANVQEAYHTMVADYNVTLPELEQPNEGILWDGLWDLDDVNGNFQPFLIS